MNSLFQFSCRFASSYVNFVPSFLWIKSSLYDFSSIPSIYRVILGAFLSLLLTQRVKLPEPYLSPPPCNNVPLSMVISWTISLFIVAIFAKVILSCCIFQLIVMFCDFRSGISVDNQDSVLCGRDTAEASMLLCTYYILLTSILVI